MLLREHDHGVIAIGQSSHAWLSGQLARAWGNAHFGRVDPLEEVCLAAEQHDIGMATWDLRPELNPDTGLPRSFMEMDIETHLELWSAAPRRLLAQSRYGAMLVSMHGCRLYELRDLAQLPPREAEAVRAYLDSQRALQQELLETLQADPKMSSSATPELVARNSQLLWTWDYLSLAICLDWAPRAVREVPSVAGPLELGLNRGQAPLTVALEPWPFSASRLLVRCDGRLLNGRWGSEVELWDALANAPWQTLEFELSARQG